MSATKIPTLYEWAGGSEALNRLTAAFYDKVLRDPLLEPIFRSMSGDHPTHVAAFLGEVFGGPKLYSEKFGGHASMISHHLNRHLTEAQRKQWIALAARYRRRDRAARRSGIPFGVRRLYRMGHAAGAAELAGRRQSRAATSRCRNGAGAFRAGPISRRQTDRHNAAQYSLQKRRKSLGAPAVPIEAR